MSLESGHHEVQVYGAESAVLRPGKLFADMWREIRESPQLAYMLAVRDLKAQYRQSLFGILWMLVPPVAWTVGIAVLKQNKLITFAPETAYVMISMALWQVFLEALRGPMGALGMYRGVLTKVRFPREAVIMADLVKLSISTAIQLVLIAFVFVYYRVPVTPALVFFPFALLSLVLLGTVLGLLLAPIGLLYKDIGNSLPLMTQFWMAITPTIFEMPSASNNGFWATMVRWNPVTPVLVSARELVSGSALTQLPQFLGVSFLAFCLLFVALLILRASMPLIIERWSA